MKISEKHGLTAQVKKSSEKGKKGFKILKWCRSQRPTRCNHDATMEYD